MKDLYDLIWEKLYFDEICESKNNGCTLHAPGPVMGKGILHAEILGIASQNNLTLPFALVEFYKQASKLYVRWDISENVDPEKKDTSLQFREDPWIKKEYIDNGYSWEAVKILLSGSLNITQLTNVVDLEKVKLT